MCAVGVALAVGVVLVDVHARAGRHDFERAADRCSEDRLARLVPQDAVARVRRLGCRELGVCVVDVVARAVGEDEVDECALFLGRLAVARRLEAARVAERVLLLEVPLHAAELGLAVLTDEHARDEDGRDVAGTGDRDAVLGLGSEDLLQRHGVMVRGALQGRQRYWPGEIVSTGRCSRPSPISVRMKTIRSPFLPEIRAQSSGFVVFGRSSFSLYSSRIASRTSSALMPALVVLEQALDRGLLRAGDDRVDHRAGREVLEVHDLLVAGGVGHLEEPVLLGYVRTSARRRAR